MDSTQWSHILLIMEDMFNDSKQILLVAKHAVSRSVAFCCEKYMEDASWAVLHLPTYWVGCRFHISANTIKYYCLEDEDKITYSFWQNSASQPQERDSVRHHLPTWAGSKGWRSSLSRRLCLSVYSVLSTAAASPADTELMCPALALFSGGRWAESSQLPLPATVLPTKAALPVQPFPSASALARRAWSQACTARGTCIHRCTGEGIWMSCSGETAWTWNRAGVTARRPTGFPSCTYPYTFAVSSPCLV